MNRREFSKGVVSAFAALGVCLPEPTVAQDKFCRWWCDLNCFRWPGDWGEPPDWIKEKFSKSASRDCYESYKDKYHELICGISTLITDEEICKYWNEIYLKDKSHSNTRFQAVHRLVKGT